MIQIYIPRGCDQQFVHRAMNHLPAQDVTKCMENSGNLHSNGEGQ